MLDNQFPEQELKQGLPPRDHDAHVPEHANSSTVWMGGIIAVCAVLALVMFGGSGNRNSASNSPNTEPGVTTGAAPATPSKESR